MSKYPEPAALKPLTGAGFNQYKRQSIELKFAKNTCRSCSLFVFWSSCASAFDACTTAYGRRGVCLLGARFYSLAWFASSGRNGKSRNRGVPDSVGEQAQYFIIDASAGILVTAVFALGLTFDISSLPSASPLDERVGPLRHSCAFSADGNSRRAC